MYQLPVPILFPRQCLSHTVCEEDQLGGVEKYHEEVHPMNIAVLVKTQRAEGWKERGEPTLRSSARTR